ncbi:MAG: glycoside hydrolase family 31 protein [Bacteroidota bacterium]|nr:glycoside hydrolase family 31 protein [Bacteroidota bacterium]
MKNTVLLVLALVYFPVLYSQQNRLSEQAGKIAGNKKIPSGYEFQLSNAIARITAYNATTIRVRVARQKMTDDFSFAIDDLQPKGKLSDLKISGTIYSFSTDSLTVNINSDPFRVSVLNSRGEDLCSDEPGLGISWFGNQVSCYKKMYADEKFIGLGEKTGDINRRGNFYQNWNSDIPGYNLNQDPLYSTIPFFIGIHGKVVYGIFFDNTHKSYFNFGGGADEELFHFGADDGEMNYYFFGGSSVQQIIKDYTLLTGRTPMPPLWSLGFQQSRYGYNSQKQLLDVATSFREKQLPADAIVSDINYMDNYKVFTWSNKYPDVKGMMDQMKQMGFDVVTIIDPGIKVEKGYKQYDEGVANNYFAKYPDGHYYIGHVWPGRCHFPDFTKPAAAAWWGRSFKEAYVANGIRGFWNDMNEPAAWGREFPNLIEFGEGKDKKTLFTVKNAYGLLMAKATFLGTKDLLNGQRPFVLTRAAYSGVQKYSAQWTGDNVASDDHMLLGFRLLNSMGLSGIPFVGMDVGGFVGNPSAELFVRWMSLGAYSPFFRNHTAIDNNYREPWLFNDWNTDKIRKILEQRYTLMPYLYSMFYRAHTTGMPINRMLPIDYTFDENVYSDKFKNQFLFGDNMLVCPVASTQNILEVYLPGNTSWYRFSDNKIYEGGQPVYVPSPLDDLPVFVKAGAVIPMQSVVQNTKEKGDGILYLHVWKGKGKTSFTYYEDDGNTYNYEKGDYCKREIVYDAAASTVTIEKKEGNYISKFNKVKMVLHGFGKPPGKVADLPDDTITITIP